MTEDVILDDPNDDFDPFHIGVSCTDSTPNKKSVAATIDFAAMADNKSIRPGSGSTVKSSGSSALPPRLLIKFKVHEEVTSLANLYNEREGESEVQIEGTLLAQVVSSDALKNIPFFLVSLIDNQNGFDFTPNDTYAKELGEPKGKNSKFDTHVVSISKESLGFVNVGQYRIVQSMDHMPLLLEQKVVRSKSNFQIAIQLRSKLSNPDDLSEISIVVFIPSQVNTDSVEATGKGKFDPWKRCITWEMKKLPKGQSFMVGAECSLGEKSETFQGSAGNQDFKFPVMLRCRSKDQISSIRFQTIEANGHPATISSSVAGKSYRIIHRLN
eukprot:CAMPEP_0168183644 /NCGR_PEP_ID=MMETSP0139_2-20121125/12713_1 /TAXON_ID=44445 /ORGANISM="Pseudo-nitzschia australis, Strain 10249 10 AB" /LENGTH=326 /DNA_ID=CAMNT_0008105007 /DNA_START=121 /DNA_END=1101 /DNA_ORIENTATION=-